MNYSKALAVIIVAGAIVAGFVASMNSGGHEAKSLRRPGVDNSNPPTQVAQNGDTVAINGTWACGSSVAALNELTPEVLKSATRNRVLGKSHSRLLWSGLHVKILSAGPSITQVRALDNDMKCWVLSDAVRVGTAVAANVGPDIPGAHQTAFANVALLQKAASPVLPSVGWNDHGESMGFMGTTDDIKLRPGSETITISGSTVDYCISSRFRNRVEEAVISALVESPKDLPLARAKVKAAAVQWFKAVGKPPPSGMLAAIAQDRQFKATTEGLSVEYVIDRCAGTPIRQPNGTSYRCNMMDLAMKPANSAWPTISWNCRSINK
jgi:hypothetical protein